MPAYLIVIRKEPIKDQDAMNEYQSRTRAITGNFDMIPRVVYGALQGLEGSTPDGVVMLEFPSTEAAKDWYNNEQYQQALPYRLQAADHQAFIVEGL